MSQNKPESMAIRLARTIATAISALPSVEAVALGGSQATGHARCDSDIDLYVYSAAGVSVEDRTRVITDLGAVNPKINENFWDVADAWRDAETGVDVEAIYWGTSWIEDKLDGVLVRHQPGSGYTTSHWYTIRNSVCLYDRKGWFAALQERSGRPYPDELRRAIIGWHGPVLRSYRHQIATAIRRKDLVSVNHRLTGLLESYFDVLFAVNGALHPGEKSLLRIAPECCKKMPQNMPVQLASVLAAVSAADAALLDGIDELLAALDRLLREEGLDPVG